MVTEVTRHEVRRLAMGGARLLDVLGPDEYADSHLPGAVNIPLHELAARAREELDPHVATVCYCYDSLCDLSPRAAWRLESLGFLEVHDYVASKVDWIGSGLPFEGSRADEPSLGGLADPDVPACTLHESLDDVRGRLGGAPRCIVVNDRRVVLGVLDAERLDAGGSLEDLMHEAPRTFRPHVTAAELGEELDRVPEWLLITNLDGTLVGTTSVNEVRAAVAGRDDTS